MPRLGRTRLAQLQPGSRFHPGSDPTAFPCRAMVICRPEKWAKLLGEQTADGPATSMQQTRRSLMKHPTVSSSSQGSTSYLGGICTATRSPSCMTLAAEIDTDEYG